MAIDEKAAASQREEGAQNTHELNPDENPPIIGSNVPSINEPTQTISSDPIRSSRIKLMTENVTVSQIEQIIAVRR